MLPLAAFTAAGAPTVAAAGPATEQTATAAGGAPTAHCYPLLPLLPLPLPLLLPLLLLEVLWLLNELSLLNKLWLMEYTLVVGGHLMLRIHTTQY